LVVKLHRDLYRISLLHDQIHQHIQQHLSFMRQKNGLGAIRTPDLRRVNSPSNDLTGPFLQSETYNGVFSNQVYTNIQNYHNTANKGLAELELPFTKNELRSYTNARKLGLTKKSEDWIERASRTFWNFTRGTVNKISMEELLSTTLKKYQSESAKGKTLTFAKGFLKYLTKTKLDSRYYAFDILIHNFLASNNECTGNKGYADLMLLIVSGGKR